ncbi:hypothetical protein CKA32_000052 [Geitlerinema sp. FC II]|nr:hypothetical protein CKA32_000052 [Geitlerinema sp. FC II]
MISQRDRRKARSRFSDSIASCVLLGCDRHLRQSPQYPFLTPNLPYHSQV